MKTQKVEKQVITSNQAQPAARPTPEQLKQSHLNELFNLLARKDALQDELVAINKRLEGLRGILGAFDQLEIGNNDVSEPSA